MLAARHVTVVMCADGIDSGLDFEKALDDPSMPKMSSPTQVQRLSVSSGPNSQTLSDVRSACGGSGPCRTACCALC